MQNGLIELLSETDNFIANAANFSAYIFSQFENINWAGFYFYNGSELILGPFQGKPACIRIALGKGVCGTAAKAGNTQIVGNIHEFAGHIACDADSKSEIVIPIYYKDNLIGVLDIDSPIFNRFVLIELEVFSKYLEILIEKSDIKGFVEFYRS